MPVHGLKADLPSGGSSAEPVKEAAWTEARTKRVRKSFMERLKGLEGEAARNLLSDKSQKEGRSKVVSILTATFKFCKEARVRPVASWKALLAAVHCPPPVMISLVNTGLAELYFEDGKVELATAVLRKEGLLVESVRLSPVVGVLRLHSRRANDYNKGYFRPLRLAVFQGLDKEGIKFVLHSAEQKAALEPDKVKRRHRLHQVKMDGKLLLPEEAAMDEGVASSHTT
jgi:hypothetical protein